MSGKFGKIRYYVEAELKTQKGYEIFTKLPFTIIRFEDLSKRVDLMDRISEESTTTLCCMSLKTKPLILSASLPFAGYTSGQNVRATIFVDNRCGFDIFEVVISLKRIHTFVSVTPETKKITDAKTIVKVKCEGVKDGDRKKILGVMEIPGMIINTSTSLSKCCQLSYLFQVKTHIVGFLQSPKIQFPIEVGTKPLNYENKI